MLIDDLERHDWRSTNEETGESLKMKSISAYWLKNDNCHSCDNEINWYREVKDLTFETKFYSEIPETLPYDKCMVRWENKSPKDSEYWGPVSTKEEVERLFYTSLRCKNGIKGTIYCFRPWIKMYEEFRCFWNGTLKAVSGYDSDILNHDIARKIHKYLEMIAHRIPYHRCVFDICRVVENGELVFKIIEFNSWETNSGGYHIDWKDNTDILYDRCDNLIYFVNKDNCFTLPAFLHISYCSPFNSNTPEKINPDNIIGGDYLYHNGFLYIHNDIWLCKFTLDLKILSWKRGIYRFSNLKLINGNICINNIKMDSDFREINYPSISNNQKDEILIYPRYGIRIRNENEEFELLLTSDCQFYYKSITVEN